MRRRALVRSFLAVSSLTISRTRMPDTAISSMAMRISEGNTRRCRGLSGAMSETTACPRYCTKVAPIRPGGASTTRCRLVSGRAPGAIRRGGGNRSSSQAPPGMSPADVSPDSGDPSGGRVRRHCSPSAAPTAPMSPSLAGGLGPLPPVMLLPTLPSWEGARWIPGPYPSRVVGTSSGWSTGAYRKRSPCSSPASPGRGREPERRCECREMVSTVL
mmetsp:Transcript_13396/g.29547  ORF Transcript_13396/g.29547 Transcript_13396/m.29547 type:complete len:216 (+) Transcript_13396:504-1151(+)